MSPSRLFLAAALSGCLVSPVFADVNLPHSDRGGFNSLASPLSGGAFKAVGAPGSGDLYQIRAVNSGIFAVPPGIGAPLEDQRNYHAFDLSDLSGSVSGATLRIGADVDAYDSSAPFETVGLFAVDPGAAANVFADLGTGDSYGKFDTSAADDSSYIDIPLNAAAIADLNAAVGIGSWSVGGALLTIDGAYNAGFISPSVSSRTTAARRSNRLPAWS